MKQETLLKAVEIKNDIHVKESKIERLEKLIRELNKDFTDIYVGTIGVYSPSELGVRTEYIEFLINAINYEIRQLEEEFERL